MKVRWKAYGIVTPTGVLMLNYIARSRRQVIDMVTGAHEQDWADIKHEMGWKIVPINITTSTINNRPLKSRK